jgi:hypothetical protein
MYCVLNWRFGAYHLQLFRRPWRVSLNFNRHDAPGGDGRSMPGWHWFEMYDEDDD